MKIFRKVSSIVGIVALAALVLFIMFFNRTPNRITPVTGIISPASGRVIAVEQFPNEQVVFDKKGVANHVSIPEITGPVQTVVIEMNLSDVHVQRVPIAGSIIRMDHYDGGHHNALGPDELVLAAENEKVVTVFKNETDTVGVVQVAGMAARRIRNRAVVGDHLEKGSIYGRILFGSQVVVLLPADKKVMVHVGDSMVDGETVISEN